jgi:ribosomal protein L21E
MEKHVYKKGDRVRITGNGSEHDWRAGLIHHFKVGEVCTVLFVETDDEEFRVLALKNDVGIFQYVSGQHVEPVDESNEAKKPFFKRLFEKFSQKH